MSELHSDHDALPRSHTFESLSPAKPDFMAFAAILGYKEDETGNELHNYVLSTQYRDESHYGEGVLAYIRHSEDILYSPEVQNRTDRLEVRQGIWLALSSLHYETGHYSNCMQQLWEIYDDMSHSSNLSHLGTVSWLIHHVGARESGRRAIIQHNGVAEIESVVPFTEQHYDITE